MRTIAPINSGFLLSSALLILCLACTHANGEVNSKELLDDAGFDLDVESAHFLDGSSNEVGQSHAKISAGCIDCSSRQRASTETGTNKHGQSIDGKSFCYRRNAELENDPNVCYKYWAEVAGSTDRIACVKVDGRCKTGGQDMKCCGGGTPPSTPSTPSASPPASAGGQQAGNQAGGCYFCGKECPKDCWNAMKRRMDEEVKNGGHAWKLPGGGFYDFPKEISECTAAMNAIPSGRGTPRQIYYNALVEMGEKYFKTRKRNVDWSPAGGWLQYGVNNIPDNYCDAWKCGPDDYAKYGRSSALGCENTCSSFNNPAICKHAAPKCKWVAGRSLNKRWVNEHCAEVDQAELLQTTDSQTTDKTETADTTRNVKRSNELDRLLDEVQIQAPNVGGFTACW